MEEARSRQNDLEARLGRPLRVHFTKAYLPLMACIAIVEVPINRLAFELFFQEAPIVSLALALGTGVILALFTHFIGTWAKRSLGVETITSKAGHWVGVALLLSLSVVAIYMLALMRQHYVQILSSTGASFDALLSGSVTQTASKIVGTEMGTEGRMLLMLNLLVFAVGCVAAFVRHDPHPDYENLVNRFKKAQKRLSKIREAYGKQLDEVTRKYDQMIANLDRQIERVEQDISKIEQEISNAEESRRSIRDRIVLHLVNRLTAYELGNRRGRGDGMIPTCFGHVNEKDLMNEISGSFA